MADSGWPTRMMNVRYGPCCASCRQWQPPRNPVDGDQPAGQSRPRGRGWKAQGRDGAASRRGDWPARGLVSRGSQTAYASNPPSPGGLARRLFSFIVFSSGRPSLLAICLIEQSYSAFSNHFHLHRYSLTPHPPLSAWCLTRLPLLTAPLSALGQAARTLSIHLRYPAPSDNPTIHPTAINPLPPHTPPPFEPGA
ncbi:hypothetical protein BO71DRAFT_124036 [Aspergillus ellipticus CBS 707.79]|uniref:Uncharacterized protein n=1 Tax=Aspergillus ellipticus CBS 707.79 TaxID=1448320 RepID=A0A319ECQ4_9EURO|nr:hypothetical protein BO71DRAFT_124036 [Aspergillus ellipticus CBS 707.79]